MAYFPFQADQVLSRREIIENQIVDELGIRYSGLLKIAIERNHRDWIICEVKDFYDARPTFDPMVIRDKLMKWFSSKGWGVTYVDDPKTTRKFVIWHKTLRKK